tara:strand:- start:1342 stop:1593 length:252 start_codon:yes stop_codon:yes gene_type:complete
MEEDYSNSIQSRKNDSFYEFNSSDASDIVSLQPRDEASFVQEVPDDTSIFSRSTSDGFKVLRVVIVIDGVATYKDILVRDVAI